MECVQYVWERENVYECMCERDRESVVSEGESMFVSVFNPAYRLKKEEEKKKRRESYRWYALMFSTAKMLGEHGRTSALKWMMLCSVKTMACRGTPMIPNGYVPFQFVSFSVKRHGGGFWTPLKNLSILRACLSVWPSVSETLRLAFSHTLCSWDLLNLSDAMMLRFWTSFGDSVNMKVKLHVMHFFFLKEGWGGGGGIKRL